MGFHLPNPISTRGVIYAHQITVFPPGFENLNTSLTIATHRIKKLNFWTFPYCSFSATTCHTVSGPEPNKACIFPFTYKDIIHEGCTDEDYDQFWCMTDLTTRKWGNCGPDCKTKGMFLDAIIDISYYTANLYRQSVFDRDFTSWS